MAQAKPIVLSMDEDGRNARIKFIDGLEYRIQHPGNRSKLEWDKRYFNPATGLDIGGYLDKFFEHCVFPEGHEKRPNIDSVTPKELGAWQELLRPFLEGGLDCPTPRGNGDSQPGRTNAGVKKADSAA